LRPVIKARDRDRAAHAAAELVALEAGEGKAGAIREEIVRVHGAVAEEFEGAAVQTVGSGFGDHDDNAATAAAVFGGVGVGENTKFLDAFDGRNRADGRNRGHVVVDLEADAIELHVAGGLLAAVDDEVIPVEGVVNARCGFGGEDAGDERGQRPDVAVVEGEIHDLIVGDCGVESRGDAFKKLWRR